MCKRLSLIKTARRVLFRAAAPLALLMVPGTAQAVSWIGSGGLWADPSKWSSGTIPSPGETVDIRFNDGIPRTVQFNFNYASPIGTFRIDQTGIGTTTFLLPSNNLASGPLTVGLSGTAAFVHLAGTNTASSGTLGASSTAFGTYTIIGGTFNVTNGLVVGSGGNGVLNVGTAGTVSAGSLTIGRGSNPGNAGTVMLSAGGVINVSAETAIGGQVLTSSSGLGSFVHTGGTLNTRTLSIGRFLSVVGSYALSGGTLNVTNDTVLGNGGGGEFAQSGGVHHTPSLSLFGGAETSLGARYTMSGGTLAATGLIAVVGGGATATFAHDNGAVTASEVRVINPGALYTMSGVGATLTVGSLDIRDGGRSLLSGGTVSAGSVAVASGGTLQLQANVTIASGMIFQNGTMTGVGTTHINSATLGFDSSTSIFGTFNVTDTLFNTVGVPIRGTGTLGTTSTGRVVGRGQILPRVNNAGTLLADSGDLILTNAHTINSGTLEAGPNASLFVNSASLTHTGNIRIAGGGAVVLPAAITNGSGKQIILLGGHLAAPSVTNAPGATIQGFGQITGNLINSGTAIFNAPTQLVGDLTNTTDGRITVRNDKLIVTGNGTNAGTILTSNGTIIFDGGVIAGPAAAGAIVVGPGGGAVASFFRWQSLNIDGAPGNPGQVYVRDAVFGGDTSVLTALSFRGDPDNWLGRLDLADADLIIDYSSASPIATVRNQLKSGFAGGSWTGNGITSSAAAASTATKTALGYAEASALGLTVFSGQPVDGTAVVIGYTVQGDANLDGTTNLTDFNSLAANFGGSNKFWSDGDFNYDGVVNLQDFNLLAANFGLSASGPDVTPQDWANLSAAVPEPVSLAGWGVPAVLGMLARRQRGARC